MAGALKHVSVAADGTVWGVNAADKIYRWTGSAWEQVAGALSQISAGSAAQVWGELRREDLPAHGHLVDAGAGRPQACLRGRGRDRVGRQRGGQQSTDCASSTPGSAGLAPAGSIRTGAQAPASRRESPRGRGELGAVYGFGARVTPRYMTPSGAVAMTVDVAAPTAGSTMRTSRLPSGEVAARITSSPSL